MIHSRLPFCCALVIGFLAFCTGQTPSVMAQSSQQPELPFFDFLDADADGKLSLEEIDDAPKRLRVLDLDRSGDVSVREIILFLEHRQAQLDARRGRTTKPEPETSPDANQSEPPKATAPDDKPNNTNISEPLSIPDGITARQAELIERFMLCDRNNDQRLSWGELPGSIRKNAFRADRNEDGYLSRGELVRFFQEQNDGLLPQEQPLAQTSPTGRTPGKPIEAKVFSDLGILVLKGDANDLKPIEAGLRNSAPTQRTDK